MWDPKPGDLIPSELPMEAVGETLHACEMHHRTSLKALSNKALQSAHAFAAAKACVKYSFHWPKINSV